MNSKNTPYLEPGEPEIVDPGANTDPVFGQTVENRGSQRVFYIGAPNGYTHRIYARCKGKGRYYALDVRKGRTVGNLIYASCFTLADAQKTMRELIKQNPDWEFKLRKI